LNYILILLKNNSIREPIIIDNIWYYIQENNEKKYLENTEILDLINQENFDLSSSTVLLLLIDIWILPIWWFNQIDYVTNYIKFYSKITWKNMNDYLKNIYMFLWFNFWDLNLDKIIEAKRLTVELLILKIFQNQKLIEWLI
jgi:hypothetical protein